MNETNLNMAECIVTKSHIGYDTMLNICTGRSVDVDWTAGDWLGASLMALMLLILLCAIAGFGALLINMFREGSL